MQIYLVGGAVRDQLLNRPIKDKDFVVVGATVAEMFEAGFKQVGADFPVFLHPDSHEEYALARTERKQGSGYKGFSVQASPDVSLKDDLQRRDLTINAMAIEVTSLTDDTPINGDVIDYYGGIADINSKPYAMYLLPLAKIHYGYCGLLAFMPAIMIWALPSPMTP